MYWCLNCCKLNEGSCSARIFVPNRLLWNYITIHTKKKERFRYWRNSRKPLVTLSTLVALAAVPASLLFDRQDFFVQVTFARESRVTRPQHTLLVWLFSWMLCRTSSLSGTSFSTLSLIVSRTSQAKNVLPKSHTWWHVTNIAVLHCSDPGSYYSEKACNFKQT